MNYRCSQPVAILLAAYNAEKFLSQQIDSVIRQTDKRWTLYVRNDASTDKTQEIIDKYLEMYPDKIIQIDRGGINIGCRDNFFKLLENIDSKYYMFCDADDVWFDDKIEQLLTVIQEAEKETPNIPILAYGDTTVCDKNLNILVPSYWKAVHLSPERLVSYNYMAVCCTAGGSCSVFNHQLKEILFPLADNDFMYDYWIALTASKHGRIKVLNRPVKFYRQHDTNVCGVTLSSQFSKFSNIRKTLEQFSKYRVEIRQLKKIGYGSTLKFYFYKFKIYLMRKGLA